MFIIGLLLAFAAGGIVTYLLLVKSPLPFPDRGSFIIATPNLRARSALISVFATNGVKPRFRIDSDLAQRVLFNDKATMINTTDPQLWQKMDQAAAGKALTVKDPVRAAGAAAAILVRHGFHANILGQLDTDVAPGAMVFLQTEAWPGGMLVFRKHVTKMGGGRPKPYKN